MEDKSNLFVKIIMTLGVITFCIFVGGVMLMIADVDGILPLWMIIPFVVWLGVVIISLIIVEIILNGIWNLDIPYLMDWWEDLI